MEIIRISIIPVDAVVRDGRRVGGLAALCLRQVDFGESGCDSRSDDESDGDDNDDKAEDERRAEDVAYADGELGGRTRGGGGGGRGGADGMYGDSGWCARGTRFPIWIMVLTGVA
jgi:hypothetical protein